MFVYFNASNVDFDFGCIMVKINPRCTHPVISNYIPVVNWELRRNDITLYQLIDHYGHSKKLQLPSGRTKNKYSTTNSILSKLCFIKQRRCISCWRGYWHRAWLMNSAAGSWCSHRSRRTRTARCPWSARCHGAWTWRHTTVMTWSWTAVLPWGWATIMSRSWAAVLSWGWATVLSGGRPTMCCRTSARVSLLTLSGPIGCLLCPVYCSSSVYKKYKCHSKYKYSMMF